MTKKLGLFNHIDWEVITRYPLNYMLTIQCVKYCYINFCERPIKYQINDQIMSNIIS